MSDIHFRIAAKTDVGLERTNNEDNFQVSANLDVSPMKWVNNQEYSLGNKGALLVVADGMGGMNAGEVASEIAIETVREMFAPEQITDEVVKTRYTIEKFMKGVVVEADKRIKEYAKSHPESRNMGTTIVIAWLFDGNLYVSWCGDSRAYIYNANTGLFQISKDHSYVQQLVDAGKISKEDAFDFPDSNIITRSLSDTSSKASPESLLMPQPLCNGDIILLCSDGLNGMIHDSEIEAIVSQNLGNMTNCVDNLIHAALEAAGADNCTVAVCQIISGGKESNLNRIPKYSKNSTDNGTVTNIFDKQKKKWLWIALTALLCAVICGLILFFTKFFPVTPPEPEVEEKEVLTDTIPNKDNDNSVEDVQKPGEKAEEENTQVTDIQSPKEKKEHHQKQNKERQTISEVNTETEKEEDLDMQEIAEEDSQKNKPTFQIIPVKTIPNVP